MRKTKENILIIIAYISIIIFIFPSILTGYKNISQSENRILQKFPKISKKEFLSSGFQKKLESFFADQYYFSEKIKLNINQFRSKTFYFLNKIIIADQCFAYQKISKNYYSFNCSEFMLKKPLDIDKEEFKNIIINYYNIDLTIPMYFYFIEKDNSIDFNQYDKNKYYEIIRKYLKFDKIENLDISNFNQYTEYFYKSDHHWNYKGSYQGYQDIMIKLFSEKTDLLQKKDLISFDFNFFGSYAKKDSFYQYTEKFKVYTFKVPKSKITINGKNSNYGHKEEYFNGFDITNKKMNHYGYYYGTDYAEVIFDFNNNKKENLLIVSSSYSNPINELIASHFNKTYIIDLRHYREYADKNFDIKNYITEKEIDKFLFISDLEMFVYPDFYLKDGD